MYQEKQNNKDLERENKEAIIMCEGKQNNEENKEHIVLYQEKPNDKDFEEKY